MISPIVASARSEQARWATTVAASLTQSQAHAMIQAAQAASLAVGKDVAAILSRLDIVGRRMRMESAFAASLITRSWLPATEQIREVLHGWNHIAQIRTSWGPSEGP